MSSLDRDPGEVVMCVFHGQLDSLVRLYLLSSLKQGTATTWLHLNRNSSSIYYVLMYHSTN